MTAYVNRVVRHVRGISPEEIEQKLELLNRISQKMTEVIQIHKVGSVWYAHYYTSLPVNLNEKIDDKPVQINQKKRRSKKTK